MFFFHYYSLKLPIPPQMKLKSTLSKDGSTKPGAKSVASDDFEVLSGEECALAPALGQDSSGLVTQLEKDLVAQLKVLNFFLHPLRLHFF